MRQIARWHHSHVFVCVRKNRGPQENQSFIIITQRIRVLTAPYLLETGWLTGHSCNDRESIRVCVCVCNYSYLNRKFREGAVWARGAKLWPIHSTSLCSVTGAGIEKKKNI